jgi:large subunit ribosomal protein L32
MRKSGANRPTVQACKNCGAPRVPHRVCMSCGQYGGEQIVAKKTAEE